MQGLFASLIAGGIALVTPAFAEGPAPFADFTFKRVAPPAQGATRRITVQIQPAPPAPVVAPAAKEVAALAPVPAAGAAAWFWTALSPDLQQASPARLDEALRVLANAPAGEAIPAPRLAALQDIVRAHGTDLLVNSIGTGVSPALALAVISVESGGRSGAVSHAGATGLMQLMPATAARFGVSDPVDPAQNIRGGIAYLDWLLDEFDGDIVLALAGYNAGENAVRKHAGVPPYAETRAYVPKVLSAWSVARGLCLTPPELVSDGCVFAARGAISND